MKVFKIEEGSYGLVVGEEVLDDVWVSDMVGEFLELMDIESGLKKFNELLDVEWMDEDDKKKVMDGLEEMKKFENVYVGDNGESEVMIFGVM